MPILVVCGECGKRLRARDELEGKRIRCPGCQAPVLVEAEDEDVSEQPARKPAATGAKATARSTHAKKQEAQPRSQQRRKAPTKAKSQDPANKPDEEEGQPRRHRKQKPGSRRKKKFSPIAFWAWAGGGIGLCLIVGITLWATGVFGDKEREAPDPNPPSNNQKDSTEKPLRPHEQVAVELSSPRVELKYVRLLQNQQVAFVYDCSVNCRFIKGTEVFSRFHYMIHASGSPKSIATKILPGTELQPQGQLRFDGLLLKKGMVYSRAAFDELLQTNFELSQEPFATKAKFRISVGPSERMFKHLPSTVSCDVILPKRIGQMAEFKSPK